eukprot:jgi/Mesvir1/16301/Mv14229-RA.1
MAAAATLSSTVVVPCVSKVQSKACFSSVDARKASSKAPLCLRQSSALFSGVVDLKQRIQWSSRAASNAGAVQSLSGVMPAVVASIKSREVLIVNTNAGGHAIIGFWLSKILARDGHKVTFLVVGDEHSDKMKKEPFSRLHELRKAGVTTVWADPSNIGATLGSAKFNTVIDNNGKDMESVSPVINFAKKAGADQFLFVSSAGIYATTDEPPHVEGDKVKDGGHAEVEVALGRAGFASGFAAFRPQYMTGLGNNKDCEEWFFDRIVRGRPVPIPGSGMQLTNIAHAADLASMIGLAVNDPAAAKNSIFNCVSNRAVSLDSIVKLCAIAAGKEPTDVKIVHYDPKAAGVDVKKAFPFRPVHFYAEPRAAVEKLGWKPMRKLPDTLKERFQVYVESGRAKKDISFPIDDQILAAVKK